MLQPALMLMKAVAGGGSDSDVASGDIEQGRAACPPKIGCRRESELAACLLTGVACGALYSG